MSRRDPRGQWCHCWRWTNSPLNSNSCQCRPTNKWLRSLDRPIRPARKPPRPCGQPCELGCTSFLFPPREEQLSSKHCSLRFRRGRRQNCRQSSCSHFSTWGSGCKSAPKNAVFHECPRRGGGGCFAGRCAGVRPPKPVSRSRAGRPPEVAGIAANGSQSPRSSAGLRHRSLLPHAGRLPIGATLSK